MTGLEEGVAVYDEFSSESDRAAAVLGGAYLDELIAQALSRLLINGGKRAGGRPLLKGPLFAFSNRVDLLCAMGRITEDEARDLSLFNEVRNAFAHRWHDLTFASPEIAGLCRVFRCIDRADTLCHRLGARAVFSIAFGIYMSRLNQVCDAASPSAVVAPKRWPVIPVRELPSSESAG